MVLANNFNFEDWSLKTRECPIWGNYSGRARILLEYFYFIDIVQIYSTFYFKNVDLLFTHLFLSNQKIMM